LGESSTYPVFLRLEDASCVVVGGGKVGERKVDGLLAAGAIVTVISPVVTPRLEAKSKQDLTWERRAFQEKDLNGMVLAVAATDDARVNESVVEAARVAKVWVNDATSADRSDFILPATVRRGDLTLAVSTGGGSPAYARLVREMLEDQFGNEHAEMVRLLAELRPRVMTAFQEASDRKAFWDKLVSIETLNMIKDGHIKKVEAQVAEWLSS
jgi:precorrin-2 dehydrogenase / sirohydrochlorin ferrochelatase